MTNSLVILRTRQDSLCSCSVSAGMIEKLIFQRRLRFFGFLISIRRSYRCNAMTVFRTSLSPGSSFCQDVTLICPV